MTVTLREDKGSALTYGEMDGNFQHLVPTGAVFHFAAATAPSGYLVCDGSAISRTEYADLFAIVETTYGAGNGSTTFNLPDLRGEFIRGLDEGRGVDTGRTIGSSQADELKSHSHSITRVSTDEAGFTNEARFARSSSSLANFPVETDLTGGTETRPRNVALLPCIKF